MSHRLGRIIWLTGVPGSGKTTLARLLVDALAARDCATLWLDSDALRHVLTPQATYSDDERDYFYGAVGHIAVLGAQGGASVVVSAVATRRRYRDHVRRRVEHFVEVYLTCDEAALRARDVKGLYAQSAAGKIDNLPGRGAVFEAPENAEIQLDSSHAPAAQLLDQLLEQLDGG